jgi:hypothetical protein
MAPPCPSGPDYRLSVPLRAERPTPVDPALPVDVTARYGEGADRGLSLGGGLFLHLDVLAGARRALVLSLSDGRDVTEGLMTIAPGGIEAEIAQLAASGTDVELRVPESIDPDELMSPAAVPKALAMGARQADADADRLRSFWAG